MTWHFCIFKLLWLAKSSETSVHDPYYCSTQNTDSQGYTCLKSSTEQQRFCVSSLSYQIRFSNYQLIDLTCLYMVGGCLQNITALLLGWGGVSRVRKQIRKALNKSWLSNSPWCLLSLCTSLLPGVRWTRVEPNAKAAPHASDVQQVPMGQFKYWSALLRDFGTCLLLFSIQSQDLIPWKYLEGS